VGKLIAADHDGNQAGYLGDCSGEDGLKSGESRVEGRASRLRESNGGDHEKHRNKRGGWAHPMRSGKRWVLDGVSTGEMNQWAPPKAALLLLLLAQN
jgi:hypothetical protein